MAQKEFVDHELIYQKILFQTCDKLEQIKKLKKQEYIQEVKLALAQKIAYEAVQSAQSRFINHPYHQEPLNNLINSITHPPFLIHYAAASTQSNSFANQIKQTIFLDNKALMFWRDDFLEIREQSLQAQNENQLDPLQIQPLQIEPQVDMYGPLWMSITYIILIGLSGNVNNYFATIDKSTFKFETDYLIKSMVVSILFFFLQTLILSGVVSCLQSHVTSQQAANLYGYSLILYFIPTILSVIPSKIWHLIMLLLGEVLKGIFIARNFSSKVESKKFIVYVAVLIFAGAHFILINSLFFKNIGGTTIGDAFNRVFHSRQFIY